MLAGLSLLCMQAHIHFQSYMSLCVLSPRCVKSTLKKTVTYFSPRSSRRLHHRVVFGQIPGHLAHEPLEALAVEAVPQLLLGRHVSRRQVAVLGPSLVHVFGVLVHPHLCYAFQVLKSQIKESVRWMDPFTKQPAFLSRHLKSARMSVSLRQINTQSPGPWQGGCCCGTTLDCFVNINVYIAFC